MQYTALGKSHHTEIAALFTESFTTAAGEEEGNLVGGLSGELATGIDDKTILCFGAYEQKALVGGLFFTQLQFEESVKVYMLAPVAVSSTRQKQGVGQALIRYGINEMKKRCVDFVMTYGDPAYYSKVGFEPASETVIKAPLTMSMPQGWQVCRLNGGDTPVLASRPKCVAPFDNSVYW